MRAGDLDRRVTLQRMTTATSDFSTEPRQSGWTALAVVWAAFRPVSDGEKWRAGMVEAREVARFTIRHSPDVSDLSGKDRLMFDGNAWGIMGVKELGRREWLEITAERVAA